MSTYLYPYKAGSESAKNLAEGLGIKRIALENSKFKGSPDKTVINWGASSVSEEVAKCRVINKPENVAIASDKLMFFKTVQDYNRTRSRGVDKVNTPSWTDNIERAKEWHEDGHIIVARTVLNGHSGRGIVVLEKGSEFVEAPLYTLYVPKKQEYRVHVAGGRAVDIQRKARREDVPDDQINWRIRNHDNGFIFARNEGLGNVTPHVIQNSVNAIKSVGLDFGAVDVIFNEKSGMSYVLEVNTAPGLSGETLENYVKNMSELVLVNEKTVKVPKYQSLNALLDAGREVALPSWAAGVTDVSNPLLALGIRESEYLREIVRATPTGRLVISGQRIRSSFERSVISWLNQNPDGVIRNLFGDGIPSSWVEG